MIFLLTSPDPITSTTHFGTLSKAIRISQPGDALALRFCVAACLMSKEECNALDYDSRIQYFEILTGQNLGCLHFLNFLYFDLKIEAFPSITADDTWASVHDPCSPTFVLLHIAFRALAVMICELLSAIEPDKLAETARTYSEMGWSRPKSFPLPPAAARIPFPSFMELPLPFALGCTEMFSMCHLRVMTSPAFIESGSWVAYFCNSLQQPFNTGILLPKFDVPLEGIQFSVSTQEGDSRVLNLRSNGRLFDDPRTFRFEAQMWTATGKINLVKFSDDGLQGTSFQALMTPFGIIGSSGEERGNWMWLWKSEWSPGSVAW
jgi:hypothetical protein